MEAMAKILARLIEQYPVLVLVLLAGGSIPTAIGWHFERRGRHGDANRWASVLERFQETQKQMLEMIERLAVLGNGK